MAACTACGRALRPEWKFCVWCGAPVERMPPASAAASPDPAERADATEPPTPPTDRPAQPDPARIDPLAVLALALGVIASPFALVFGHAALARIRRTHRAGRMPALIGTTLGYGWAVLAAALLVSLLLVPRG